MSADTTVVIACFNYGDYLGEAVASALEQPGGAPHVVVVDDGSTDPATHETLTRLASDVEIVRQPNRGVCAARNAGLARVGTPFALVLDADDRLAPGALPAMRAALDDAPELGFAYGWMRFFGAWRGVMRFPGYDPYRLLYRHMIGLSALMRREVVEATGGFDPAFAHYEDWELWVNALAHGWRGVQVPVVTLEYRRHAESKLALDRARYRDAFRRLRSKHAELYARRGELARETGAGPARRLAYEWFWGRRPIPGRVERALHQVRFGRSMQAER